MLAADSSTHVEFLSGQTPRNAAICADLVITMEYIAMGKISSHKDLIVWRKSVSLASKVYTATAQLPKDERYGLSSQMRRSAVAVASNIAEGAGRSGRGEYIQFLNIARGSLSELETQLLITAELKLIDSAPTLQGDVAEVGRLLTSLIRKLRERRELV
jgi:four helix bundle protein